METLTTARILQLFEEYWTSRRSFLVGLGLPATNRDPLSEFSELLVLSLLGGTRAASRVQKGYDLIDDDGQRVEVKYLANPSEGWVNEHQVIMTEDRDLYALVIFEDLRPISVIVFPRMLSAICAFLGKKHPGQETTLQLTRANYRRILSASELPAGLRVFALDAARS